MNKVILKYSKHYSPLRYPGGKSCLSEYFKNLLSKNSISNCTYVEPFAGGAGAAMKLLLLEEVDRIIINDLDQSIYAFWWAILKKGNQFIDKIRTISVNIKEWSNQKNILSNKRSTLFDRGFAAFYLNRTNRSGILDGGPIGGKEQLGKWKLNARFNKDTLIERIQTISMYSKRIQLSNLDGIELLKQTYKQKNTLVYLDPPYFYKARQLYLNHYSCSDHKKLANFLNTHPNFNWLLTYDNVEEIRKLYQKRKRKPFNITYSASETRLGKELMIFSDILKG